MGTCRLWGTVRPIAGFQVQAFSGFGNMGCGLGCAIAAPDLDFSSMQTRTQRQANLFGCGRKCQRATYGATGSIEGSENAVTSVLDQAAALSFNHLARQLIVTVQQSTPVLITHFGSAAS